MSWSENLDVASFRGYAFEVLSLSDSLNHRYAEYKYPYRNGADLSDLGRDPRKTTVRAVFFGSEYEQQLRDFIALVDEGKTGTFAHPVLGQWQAKCNITSIEHSFDDRDAASLDLEFIEDGTSTKIPELNSINKLKSDIATYAATINALNVPTEATTAATDATTFSTNAGEDDYDVVSGSNQVRKKIDTAIQSTRNELSGSAEYNALLALNKLAYSVQKLAARVQSEKSHAIEETITVETPLVMIAHRRHGDWTRFDEIRKVNQIRNPFMVEVGTKLKIYTS